MQSCIFCPHIFCTLCQQRPLISTGNRINKDYSKKVYAKKLAKLYIYLTSFMIR